jgi:hypothetical protein
MTRVRLQQLFGRLDRKGLTYSVGTGSATRRGLKGEDARRSFRDAPQGEDKSMRWDRGSPQRDYAKSALRAPASESAYRWAGRCKNRARHWRKRALGY